MLDVTIPTPEGEEPPKVVYRPEDAKWIAKHSDGKGPDALVGGYVVDYEDGYVSWSPAGAFEEGYELLHEPDESTDPAADTSSGQAGGDS